MNGLTKDSYEKYRLCSQFKELVSRSLINEDDSIELRTIDEFYNKIRTMIVQTKENKKKWYDDEYYSDIDKIEQELNKFEQHVNGTRTTIINNISYISKNTVIVTSENANNVAKNNEHITRQPYYNNNPYNHQNYLF